jgi:hypothetical protein
MYNMLSPLEHTFVLLLLQGGLQDIHTLKQEVTVEEHDMMQER